MSKLQQINVFLNETLTAVPLEISVVVKKTIAEYQEEIYCLKRANARLRRLLNLVFKPEIKLRRLADLQQLTLTGEVVNPEQQHYEQEWSASLGPVESDAEESIWNSINITTVENQTEFDGERYRESDSTSEYQPPSEVNPESDNDESDHVKEDEVENRIRLSRLTPLKSKRGRGRPRKEARELPDLNCDLCGKCFATAGGLRRHQQNVHGEERPRGRPKKGNRELPDLKCDVCGKCLATARSLKRHRQNRHLDERPRGRPRKETSELPNLTCDVCGKCFVTRRGLQMHGKNRHSEERPYMCDICGQGFVLNCYLIRHMKTHTEEGQHCCTICGKCFNHKNNLKNHMGTHSGPAF